MKPNDTLIVRIKADETPIFITSYSMAGLGGLHLEVERVDVVNPAPAPAKIAARGRKVRVGAPSEPLALGGAAPKASAVMASSVRYSDDGRPILPTRIVAHISRLGDVSFVDQPAAGRPDQRLPIEAFKIEPLSELGVMDIEYKGLTEKGVESPWTPGGVFCGTKGMKLALAGFSVRVKGEKARLYECRYTGRFVSGAQVGPLMNGAPLHTGRLDDFLVALEVEFLPLQVQGSPLPSPRRDEWASAPAQAPARAAAPVFKPLQWSEEDAEAPAPPPRRVVGPRFSVFRDDGE